MKSLNSLKKMLVVVVLIPILFFTFPVCDNVFGEAEFEQGLILKEGIGSGYYCMPVGSVEQGWSLLPTPGNEISHVKWKSDNTDCFTVQGNDLMATVTAIKEGTGILEVNAVITEGKNIQGTCFLSVFTPFSEVNATANQEIVAYPAASKQEEPVAALPKGQKMRLKGKCGAFYWVKLPPNVFFNNQENQEYAFVDQTLVTISKNVATINCSKKVLKKSQKFSLKLKMSNPQNYEWVSNNSKIASINNNGVVTGLERGKATITAISSDKHEKIASCNVTVVNRHRYQTLSSWKLKKRDEYGFSNWGGFFFSRGEKQNYYMTKADRKKLGNKLYSSYGSRFSESKATINLYVKSKYQDPWNGACYGLSSTVALNCMKQINIKQKTGFKGKYLRQAKKPKNSKKTKSLIHYYQIAQWYTEQDSAYYNKNYVSGKTWKGGLKRLVKYTKTHKKVQMFTFHTTYNVHHAILLKKYKGIVTKNGIKWYKFSSYDPSCPDAKICAYVRTDYKSCTVGSATTKYGTVIAFSHMKNFSEFKNIKY